MIGDVDPDRAGDTFATVTILTPPESARWPQPDYGLWWRHQSKHNLFLLLAENWKMRKIAGLSSYRRRPRMSYGMGAFYVRCLFVPNGTAQAGRRWIVELWNVHF